jgi:hypothetical protein
MTYGGPIPLTSGHHACSEVAVRDRIVLSTFRFSGVADVQVAKGLRRNGWWLPSLPSGLIRSVARRTQTI